MFSSTKFRDWLLLLACNLIWASQFVMVKLVQEQMGPVFATFFPMTIATLLLIPIVLREKDVGVRRADIAGFVLLGIGQVRAQLLITWFFGVVLVAVILREHLTATMIASGVLVLASTLLATVHENRQSASALGSA